MNSLKPLSLLALFALTLSGCYHLGNGNKTSFSSISLAPIENRSFAPQVHALLSDALFRAFARSGGVAVEPQDSKADVVLKVTVNDFQKFIGATSSVDTGRARSLVMTLRATAVLTDTEGNILHSQDFEVTKEFYADSGAARAEQQGMPQLANDLAVKIQRAVMSSF